MNVAQKHVSEQPMEWNGRRGQAWVDAQESLDRLFKPFEDMLVEAVAAASGRSVLDVGCGTGSTTLAVARLLGANGRAVGVDISEPMIAAAKAGAEREGLPAEFVSANAEVHAFEPARFDTIISRFGVMFFDDPVKAFAGLRNAVKGGGSLRAIAWRSAAENPFMTTAERAAAPFFPSRPARRPDEPKGQFAFGDPRRVRGILQDSGWAEIDIRPIDIACTLPEPELMQYYTRLGPLGLILEEADDESRKQVIAAVGAAFAPYVHGPEVRFDAAGWLISAQAPVR